jgi:hypothetical protein
LSRINGPANSTHGTEIDGGFHVVNTASPRRCSIPCGASAILDRVEVEVERLPGASRPKPGAGKTAGLLAVALVAAALAQAQDRGEKGRVPQASEGTSCCFSNPRYSGVCMVEPGADGRAPRSRLPEQPQSQGKSYCGSTSVRGGWRQVGCKGK